VEPCLFCESVAGRLPQAVVYADGEVMAFLDWRQTAPGHVLVIPRRHLSAQQAMRSEVGAALLRCAALVSEAVLRALEPDGLQLGAILANLRDTAETAEDGHFHLHILPRRHAGETARIYPFGDHVMPGAVLEDLAARIRSALVPW